MTELKPCPFCGGEAVPIEDTVECESCDFGTYNSLWNQRVPAIPIPRLVDFWRKVEECGRWSGEDWISDPHEIEILWRDLLAEYAETEKNEKA